MALLRRFVVCSVAVGICGVDVCGVVKLLHPPHSQKKGHFPRRLEKKKRGDKNLGKEVRRDRDWQFLLSDDGVKYDILPTTLNSILCFESKVIRSHESRLALTRLFHKLDVLSDTFVLNWIFNQRNMLFSHVTLSIAVQLVLKSQSSSLFGYQSRPFSPFLPMMKNRAGLIGLRMALCYHHLGCVRQSLNVVDSKSVFASFTVCLSPLASHSHFLTPVQHWQQVSTDSRPLGFPACKGTKSKMPVSNTW